MVDNQYITRSTYGLTTWRFNRNDVHPTEELHTQGRCFGVSHVVMLLASLNLMGGLLYGTCLSLGGVLDSLSDHFHINGTDKTTSQQVVSSASVVGGVLLAPFGGLLADFFGRVPTIMVSAFLTFAGSLASIFSPSIWFLIVCRFLVGVGAAASVVVIPTWVSECSPVKGRGPLVALFQLSTNLGFALAFAVDLGGWRMGLGFGALAPIIVLLITVLFVPESPRWLLSKHNRRPLIEDVDVPHQTSINYGNENENENISDILSPNIDPVDDDISQYGKETDKLLMSRPHTKMSVFRQIFMAFCLAIVNNGINGLTFYGPQIAMKAGFGSEAGIHASIGLGAISVFGAIGGIFFMMRYSPRIVLLVGLFVMWVSHFLLAISFQWMHGTALTVMFVCSVTTLILGFQVGPGPGYFVFVSLIFPQRYRGICVGATTLFLCLFNLAMSLTFLSCCNKFGLAGTFMAYGVLFMLCWIGCFLLPDTRGRTIEEITDVSKS